MTITHPHIYLPSLQSGGAMPLQFEKWGGAQAPCPPVSLPVIFVYIYAVTMNSCLYIAAVCIRNCFKDVLTVVFLYKQSQMFCQMWSVITNQVTYGELYVLT